MNLRGLGTHQGKVPPGFLLVGLNMDLNLNLFFVIASIVTYNALMTALEKGLQWERALDLFDEMKMKGLAVTVRIHSKLHGVSTLLAHETSLWGYSSHFRWSVMGQLSRLARKAFNIVSVSSILTK